ncbi:hypothetical protein [Pseudorhodoferax sp. LjRoot39]|uniref:hypothetical protein n=1 Tax=Pseudorhodoferax sp. LjRoot39 TaxID=3342328 RepID=UPI003F50246D
MLSIWLSAANTAAASARSRTTAATKRQVASVQTTAVQSMLDFWTGSTVKPKPKRRSRR